MMDHRAFQWIGVILVLILAMVSCQAKFLTGQGNFVPEEKRLDLPPEGSASGSWQGKTDLTVNYTTARTPEVLQISGDIVFRKQKKLVGFQFSTVLIDGEGRVLEVVPVTSAGGRRKIEQISFNKEIPLPPETRYFAFMYDGATSGTGQGGSPKSFWSAPW